MRGNSQLTVDLIVAPLLALNPLFKYSGDTGGGTSGDTVGDSFFESKGAGTGDERSEGEGAGKGGMGGVGVGGEGERGGGGRGWEGEPGMQLTLLDVRGCGAASGGCRESLIHNGFEEEEEMFFTRG